MNNQLELSLVDQIWQTYSEAANLSDKARHFIGAAVFKARECGIFLLEAKTLVGHGNFISWLDRHFGPHVSHGKHLNRITAWKYMRLARTSEDNLKDAVSIRQALRAIELIESGEKVDPINRDPEGTNWIGVFDKLNIKVAELFDARPLHLWNEDEKAIFVERTRPVVNKFLEAGGKL